MKYNMADEVDHLPSSKKEEAPEKEGSHVELSRDQMEKREEALAILNSLASECGCSISDLLDEDYDSEESGDAMDEEDQDEHESSDKGKKLALYVAQMKAKRG